jgi:tetratricopeptide (TPR) repeat protein
MTVTDRTNRSWQERLAAAHSELESMASKAGVTVTFERGRALVEVGRCQMALRKPEAADQSLAEAAEIFQGRRDASNALAKARMLRAQTNIVLRRYDEVLVMLDRLDDAGGDFGIRDCEAYVARMRLESLIQLGRYEEALQLSTTVLAGPQLKTSSGGSVTGFALWAQSKAAQQLGQTDVARRAADSAVAEERASISETVSSEDREGLALVMVHRAGLLDELGDRRAARAALDEFIQAFSGSANPTDRDAVRKARARKVGLRLGIPARSRS